MRSVCASVTGIIGVAVIIFLLLTALIVSIDEYLLGGVIIEKAIHADPYEMDYDALLRPPSREHLLGTTALGRDVLARMLYGTRVSVIVGVLAVAISGTVGTTVGLLSGYLGGSVDAIIMRIVDILLAFPSIVLAIAFVSFLGPSLMNVVFALSLRGWVSYARLMRAEVLKRKEKEYVLAGRAIGADSLRIMFIHILRNSLSPIIVRATMELGGMIVAEAGLSFLGLGVQPPTASWGRMLSMGRTYITTAWWLSVFPGAAIFITVMGFNLFGDALRDSLDPRLRQRL